MLPVPSQCERTTNSYPMTPVTPSMRPLMKTRSRKLNHVNVHPLEAAREKTTVEIPRSLGAVIITKTEGAGNTDIPHPNHAE